MCDVSEERLKHLSAVYPGVECVTNYDSLINDQGLDAVVIATAVRFHYSMARASLLAGKHTFIEKPMAASAAECEELVEIARKNGLVLMVGHTFLYSPAVRKIKEIVDKGDVGEIRYISARRLNLGLFQKDINVAWDLAPHDISIIQYIMGEQPTTVNCNGSAHITPGIEDVTVMCLGFDKQRTAIIHSSWLDPRKVREMTIVGSKRMIVYDDVAQQEKIKVFDSRVERPPHYDTFAEFHYAYHYGDIYVPYIKQEEPLKVECQHFLDCIKHGTMPLTSGRRGYELVQILEASSESLRVGGGPVLLRGSQEAPRPAVVQALSNGHAAAGNGHSNGNGNGNGHGNGHVKNNGNGKGNGNAAALPKKDETVKGRAATVILKSGETGE
jgi:predicted dehydrogenase